MISLFDQMRKAKLLKQYIIFLSAIILFHSVIYYPLYLYLDSNVLWRSSVYYLLLTEIAEPLAGYLFFWCSFAYLIYVGVRFSYKSTLPFLSVYCVGTLLKYLIQNVCFIIMMGFNLWNHSLRVFDLIFSIAMDLLVIGFAMLFLFLVFKNKPRVSEEGDPLGAYMPFAGFFRFSNPMQKLTLFMALLPSGARLVSRAYYDVRLFLEGRIPDTAPEVFLVITYYITDALTALVGCLVIMMMLSYFRLFEEKAKIEYENQ